MIRWDAGYKLAAALCQGLGHVAKGKHTGVAVKLGFADFYNGRRKGRRGRGAGGKAAVFGILQRGGKVYTKVIEDAGVTTLPPIIRRRVVPDSIVSTDYWRSYNALKECEWRFNYGSPK